MGSKGVTSLGRAQAALVAALLCASIILPAEARAAKTTTVANPAYEEALAELNRITDAYGALAEEQDATLSQLEDVRKQIAANETKMSDVEQDVKESKAKLKEKQEALAGQVSAEYKSGGVSLLSIVFSSSSFEDIISRIHYHSIICAAEMDKIDEVNAAREELEKHQSKLEKIEASLEEEESDLEALYGEQRERTEAMYEQQLAAHELVASLPAEIQQAVEDEADELIPDADPVDAEAEDQKGDETGDQQDGAADKDAQADQDKNADKQEGSQEQSTDKTSDKTDTTKSTEDSSKKSTTTSEKKDTTSETTKKDTSTSTKKDTTTQQETTPEVPKQKKTTAGTMQAVLDSAYSTSGSEALNNGWGCAGWVYTVFRNSGVYNKKPTCAAWYYNNWCYSSDKSDLQPGMVIAVSTWTGTAAGKRYGHVGIYIGNNTVRHLSAGAVREMSVDKWIRQYGTTVTPRWGWNGGIVLS